MAHALTGKAQCGANVFKGAGFAIREAVAHVYHFALAIQQRAQALAHRIAHVTFNCLVVYSGHAFIGQSIPKFAAGVFIACGRVKRQRLFGELDCFGNLAGSQIQFVHQARLHDAFVRPRIAHRVFFGGRELLDIQCQLFIARIAAQLLR